jgi:glyoxylase-like metal-dependent hydrolase (beta-lactamase superfamily II)
LIIPIHAVNPGVFTGRGNWTYLITGAVPVLIDAGVGQPEHLDAIATQVSDGPARVIVTHAHEDHASGVSSLAARWPRAQFVKWPWPERDAHHPVEWRSLSDGQVVPAGDGSLEVVHTPGHSPDHICLWQASDRTLFCGDLVVKGSTVVIPASSGGDLAEYLRSLERVNALDAKRLLPAHGEPIDDARSIIRSYVEHRHERERQVLDAITAGATSVDSMVARIYTALVPALLPMARESVLAHLFKLEHEGRVCRVENEWRIQT